MHFFQTKKPAWCELEEIKMKKWLKDFGGGFGEKESGEIIAPVVGVFYVILIKDKKSVSIRILIFWPFLMSSSALMCFALFSLPASALIS